MTSTDESTYVKVAIIDNIIEAQVLESLLKEQKIPYRIRSFHDTAYDGLFQLQKGWGEILAPQAVASEILELIKNVKTSNNKTSST